MTLPAKWNDIKNKSGIVPTDGCRNHDIHPDEDDSLIQAHHTHCSECDKPYNTTQHFYDGGIICTPCMDDKFPDCKCSHDL